MDSATFMHMLEETREQWEELLAQFGEQRMLQPGATGKWSVKDIIVHVSWSEREMVPVIQTHVFAGSPLWDLSVDERNDIWYQQNRERSLQDIVSEEQQAYDDLLAAAQTLSDEDLNDAHRFQQMPQEWVPWRIFAGNSFDHYQEHMPALRTWLSAGQES